MNCADFSSEFSFSNPESVDLERETIQTFLSFKRWEMQEWYRNSGDTNARRKKFGAIYRLSPLNFRIFKADFCK